MPALFHLRLRMAMQKLYTQFPLVDSTNFKLLFSDGFFPVFIGGPGDDEKTATMDVRNVADLEHLIDGFLARVRGADIFRES